MRESSHGCFPSGGHGQNAHAKPLRVRADVGGENVLAGVRGYKPLKFVEQDIRDTKTELELRPVLHRLEDRVRCHAFLCLLAQYVRWHMMRALELLLAEEKAYPFELLVEHLETIQRNTMEIAGQQFNLTTQPDELQCRVFAHLGLPRT